jgi:SAM-dependent methyltransferase
MLRRKILNRLPIRRSLPEAERQLDLPPHVRIPADLADADGLRDYLADCSVFTDAREAEGYLTDALERFRVTMAALERVPVDAAILELGSNPYFLTRLLRRRGNPVTCANYFGDHWPAGPSVQEVGRLSDGVTERFDFDHFNIESGPFPYPDSSFDVVLFCEILEHLPFDPVNALGEIHRVLRKDTGMVLITTPNAIRAGNVARLLRGENVYESLSGYGAYGRHNREYTLDELDRLLSANGFEMVDNFTANVHAHDEHTMPAASNISHANRGDNLFCLARAVGEDRWAYPDWLFTSKPALYGRRIVAPDVVIGVNDDLQSTGLHSLENGPAGTFRWMGPGVVRVLTEKGFAGPGRLVLQGFTPPIEPAMLPSLKCTLGGQEKEWSPREQGGFKAAFEFDVSAGVQEAQLAVSRTWSQADSQQGADARRLGLALQRISWIPSDG